MPRPIGVGGNTRREDGVGAARSIGSSVTFIVVKRLRDRSVPVIAYVLAATNTRSLATLHSMLSLEGDKTKKLWIEVLPHDQINLLTEKFTPSTILRF